MTDFVLDVRFDDVDATNYLWWLDICSEVSKMWEVSDLLKLPIPTTNLRNIYSFLSFSTIGTALTA